MEKLTKKELLAIGENETFCVALPNYKACQSAKTYAYSVAREMGWTFSVSIKRDNRISIKRVCA